MSGSRRPGRVDGFLLTDPELEDPRLRAARGRRAPRRHRRAARAGLAVSLGRDRSRPRHGRGGRAPRRARARADRVSRRRRRPTSTSSGGSRAGARRCAGRRARRRARSGLPAARARRRGMRCSTASRRRSSARATRWRWRSCAAAREPGPARSRTTCRSPASTTRVLAALSSPGLTSVRVDYAEFGAAAAAALLARIDGEEPPRLCNPSSARRSSVRASTREPGRPARRQLMNTNQQQACSFAPRGSTPMQESGGKSKEEENREHKHFATAGAILVCVAGTAAGCGSSSSSSSSSAQRWLVRRRPERRHGHAGAWRTIPRATSRGASARTPPVRSARSSASTTRRTRACT